MFAVALLSDIAQTIAFRQLIFDPVPFSVPDPSFRSLLLWPWLFFSLLLLLGVATRLAALGTYALNVYFLGFYFTDRGVGWQVDGLFILGSIFLIFMPSDRAWSIKRHLEVRAARAASGTVPPPRRVRRVWSAALAFTVATLYAHAVLWQTSSLMWLGGLGLWGPASLPYNTYYNVAPFLDNLPLMLTVGYVALVYEVVFPVAIWIRWLRAPLVTVGLTLHLGIALIFPIPVFSLVLVALYLGFVPEGIYERWYDKWKGRSPLSGQPPASTGTLAHVSLSAGLLAVWLVCEVIIVGVSPFVPRYLSKAPAVKEFTAFAAEFNSAVYPWTGLSSHGILMDKHFHFYRSQFLVTFREGDREIILPMTTEKGIAGPYAWNRMWVTWTLQSASPLVPEERRDNRIKRFAAFWVGEHDIDAGRGEFVVYERPVKVSLFLWVDGLLQKNRVRRWKEVSRFSLDL